VNDHRSDRDAINIIYKSLQQDREQADISAIIRELHEVVDEAIDVRPTHTDTDDVTYDISKIDFERLRQEFTKSHRKNTTVQTLRQVVEQRLHKLLQQNPLRTDFQQHYEIIVSEYNREKDRVTIEQTFEALLKLVEELNEEERRAVREGLDEESLAIFDLLRKPELDAKAIKRVKKVAITLLEDLKSEKLKIDHWRDKESTRDSVRVVIRNFLWNDKTGLPTDYYDEEDVGIKSEDVYRHVFRAYPSLPSPYYATAS
jgi:type I restriction enzyme R subunit